MNKYSRWEKGDYIEEYIPFSDKLVNAYGFYRQTIMLEAMDLSWFCYRVEVGTLSLQIALCLLWDNLGKEHQNDVYLLFDKSHREHIPLFIAGRGYLVRGLSFDIEKTYNFCLIGFELRTANTVNWRNQERVVWP